MEKMRMESLDFTLQNIERIGELFPNCITETAGEDGIPRKTVNFRLLCQMLSPEVMEGDERYEFTWVGKKAAIVEANRPIRKTLRPCMDESRNWAQTENLYLEGDNLDILKLLQESYLESVKMIYIDPPYNTGHDFIYPDKFVTDDEEYDAGIGIYDEEGNINFKRENNLSNGKYHSLWCSMIYSRLLLARNLLRRDGLIFLSIDDHELDDLLKICNEVFGAGNLLACFPRVTKKAGKTTDAIARNHDYILAYSKSTEYTIFLPEHTDRGFKYEDEFVETRGKYKLNQTLDYDSLQYSAGLDYPITIDGETFYPGQSYEKYLERQKGNHARADWAWRWSRELFDFGYKNGFIVIKKYGNYSRIYTKTYQNARLQKTENGFAIAYSQRTRPISTLEFVGNEFSNDNSKKNLNRLFERNVFDYSKPVALLRRLVQYATSDGDIVLDFFSGSGTTAQAVIQENAAHADRQRKFIMVQLAEPCDEKSDAYRAGYKNICEMGKERIRRSIDKVKSENPDAGFDDGFRVFKLDDTNMRDVYYSAGEYTQEMLPLMELNIKEDRNSLDLLFGCVLEWGLPLSLPHTFERIQDCTVHEYNGKDLIACFDEAVSEPVIREIAKKKPLRAVFRDGSFADSASKINVYEIFKSISPDTRVRII